MKNISKRTKEFHPSSAIECRGQLLDKRAVSLPPSNQLGIVLENGNKYNLSGLLLRQQSWRGGGVGSLPHALAATQGPGAFRKALAKLILCAFHEVY